ncbi:MAG: response regulator [Myxococcota bacterium]
MSPASSAGATGYRVLIADDDKELAQLLSRYFQARGIDVTLAHDGEVAWQQFVTQPPHIVVMDLMMPKLDGRGLIARIRSHLTAGRTPLVVMSGALSSAQEEQALVARLKVEGAFRKPLVLNEMLESMDRLVALTSGRRRVSSGRMPAVPAAAGKPHASQSPSSARLAPVTEPRSPSQARMAPVAAPPSRNPSQARMPPVAAPPSGSPSQARMEPVAASPAKSPSQARMAPVPTTSGRTSSSGKLAPVPTTPPPFGNPVTPVGGGAATVRGTTSSRMQAVPPPPTAPARQPSSPALSPVGNPFDFSPPPTEPGTATSSRPPSSSQLSAVPVGPPAAFGDVPPTPAPIAPSTSAMPPATFGMPVTQPGRSISSPKLPPVSRTSSSPSLTPVAQAPAAWGSDARPAPSAPTVQGPKETPRLAGEATLLSLTTAVVEIFEHRLRGIMEMKQSSGTRRLAFVDGLIVAVSTQVRSETLSAQLVRDGVIDEEKAAQVNRAMEEEGLRFGEAMVRVLGARHSLVVEALERQVKRQAATALASEEGIYELIPWDDDPMLATTVRLDPVETVQRACLEFTTEESAGRILGSFTGMHLLRGNAFNERVLVFMRLCPNSDLPARLMDEPTVPEALQRCRGVSPTGVRELLSLILSQAIFMGRQGTTPPLVRRTAALTSSGGEWRPAGLLFSDLSTREAVAAEWIRTGGRDAYGVLGVTPDVQPAGVAEALASLTARFGPPSMDGVNLGPAKTYLEIIRARRDEAARILSNPQERAAYDARLAQRRQAARPGDATRQRAQAERLLEDGKAALKRTDVHGAHQCFTSAVSLMGNEAEYQAYLAYAEWMLANGAPGPWVERLALALRLDPNCASAWRFRAEVLEHQGSHQEALAAAEKAVRLNPSSTEARQFLDLLRAM